jgi:hypothetical protein
MTRAARWLQWGAAVNVVWDGNSLVYGVGSTAGNTLPEQAAALAPMAGAGAAWSNVGVSGQTWVDMQSATDVDALWVNGKANVLLTWEGTNSIINSGRTPMQALGDAAAYTTARRAAHPWIIATLTTLPRQAGTTITDQASRDARNADLVSYNSLLMASPQAYGFDVVVDVRPSGGPFAFTGYADGDFAAADAYWRGAEVLTNARIHLANTGYALIAGYVAAALRRLPRVPH